MLNIQFTANGIFLPDSHLWLDPQTAVDWAWLSHAHSDHARGLHGEVWASRHTLELYRMRWPDPEARQRTHALPWGQPFTKNGLQLTAYPAGHILGAAQLLIESEGERIVYTGDIKLRAPLCGEATEVIPCDRLIIESTFGLPIYHFLDRFTAAERMLTFARETLSEGAIPVFLGYPLGRGQEIVHVLTTGGIPTRVHGAIARYLPAYERAGIPFGPWAPYAGGPIEGPRHRWSRATSTTAAGTDEPPDAGPRCAYVVVPGMRATFEASSRDCRLAYVSGWAALANARARSGAEELIPYSDHADFDELIELILRTGARRVDLVHGYAEPLARILNARGLDAHAPAPLAARPVAPGEELAE